MLLSFECSLVSILFNMSDGLSHVTVELKLCQKYPEWTHLLLFVSLVLLGPEVAKGIIDIQPYLLL